MLPVLGYYNAKLLTAPLFPGKLKNWSGPCRCGIDFNTDNSFVEWRTWKKGKK